MAKWPPDHTASSFPTAAPKLSPKRPTATDMSPTSSTPVKPNTQNTSHPTTKLPPTPPQLTSPLLSPTPLLLTSPLLPALTPLPHTLPRPRLTPPLRSTKPPQSSPSTKLKVNLNRWNVCI
jgi:hypothetical protein